MMEIIYIQNYNWTHKQSAYHTNWKAVTLTLRGRQSTVNITKDSKKQTVRSTGNSKLSSCKNLALWGILKSNTTEKQQRRPYQKRLLTITIDLSKIGFHTSTVIKMKIFITNFKMIEKSTFL